MIPLHRLIAVELFKLRRTLALFVALVLPGVIALLFWIYVSANILLFGAEVSAEFGHVMRGEPRHGRPARDGGGEDADWRRSLVTMLRGLVFAPPVADPDADEVSANR